MIAAAARVIAVALALCAVIVPTASARPPGVEEPNARRYLDGSLPFHEPPSRGMDLAHLTLEVSVDPASARVKGSATWDLRVLRPDLDALVFDAVALDVRSVTLLDPGGAPVWRPLRFEARDGELRVFAPAGTWSPVEAAWRVRIVYEASPRQGLYVTGPSKAYPKRPLEIWTQGETEEARHWLPCVDAPSERFTWELEVGLPRALALVSNGEPAGVREDGALRWHRFRMTKPHPAYLLSLVGGEYVPVEHAATPVRVTTWVHPGQEQRARAAFERLPKAVEILGRRLGLAYPHARYGQVIVHPFFYGGMENVTLSTLSVRGLHDARTEPAARSEGLAAHELGHQWFGDTVTCSDWAHLWLNEGGAVFAEKLWREEVDGADAYGASLERSARSYFDEARDFERPLSSHRYDDAGALLDGHAYNKGAWIFHMLRRKLGDAAFFAGLRRFFERHALSAVEPDDLRRAFEARSGVSLVGFFDRWVRHAGHPIIEVRQRWDAEHKLVRLEFHQAQPVSASMPLFRLEIPVHVQEGSGRTRGFVYVLDRRDGTLTVPQDETPKMVEIDPHQSLLVEWRHEAGADDHTATLVGGRTIGPRLRAARALGAHAHDAHAAAALASVLASKAHVSLRAVCAASLGRADTEATRAALLGALGDREAEVRQAAALALGDLKSKASVAAAWPRLAKMLADDGNDGPRAAAMQALSQLDPPRSRALALDLLDEPSHLDALRSAGLAALARIGDARDGAVLRGALAPGAPEWSRRPAPALLVRWTIDHKERTDETRALLESVLDDPDWWVRFEVVGALGELGDPKSRPALERVARVEPQRRLVRRAQAAIRALGHKDVPGRLDALERELRRMRDVDRR